MGLSGMLLSGNASAVLLANEGGGGTAFFVAGNPNNNVYNQEAVIVGGSSAGTISEFITLALFDSAILPADEVVTGATLTIAVNGDGGGSYSGTLQAEYIGSFATIPDQEADNNTPDVNELIRLAFDAPADEVFNGTLAVGDSQIVDVASAIDIDNRYLLFRFSDVAPAPTANQQSGVIATLDVVTAPVPEPSVALLSAFAGLGLLVRRRR